METSQSGFDALQKGNEQLNVLHLSDLHFGVENKPGNDHDVTVEQRMDLFTKLIKTIDSDIEAEWKPDVIIVSGDIAFTGKDDEYKSYYNDLYPLLKNLLNSSDADNRIIMCPGNHDIIRSKVKNPVTGSIKRPEKDVYDIPADIPALNFQSIIDQDHGRWQHFEFYVKNCCDGDPRKLCRTVTFKEWPWIHFLVLNSAWDCQDDQDDGHLRVGYAIARHLYTEIPKNEKNTVVAIFHHPLSTVEDMNRNKKLTAKQWLHCSEIYINENQGRPCFGNFITRNVDVVLNGHIHNQMDPVRLGRTLNFINGTVHSDDTYQYHCRIIKFRKYAPPEYIDLSRKLSETGSTWDVKQPKSSNDPYINAWDKANEEKRTTELKSRILELMNRYKNRDDLEKFLSMLGQFASLLGVASINDNNYNMKSLEESKDLIRTLE